ncbi:hypothetical protein K439DRAFT_1629264 [Ramaria rubella]|nr:hypothetical protein K439DRAFT_1629264 [Ramaria rubella]
MCQLQRHREQQETVTSTQAPGGPTYLMTLGPWSADREPSKRDEPDHLHTIAAR